MTPEFTPEAEIAYFTESIDFTLPKSSEITNWLEEVIDKESQAYEQINFIFCSDDYLLEINRTHLDHDDYTDVITFCLSEEPVEADIFISIDRVKENASLFNVPFLTELYRVIVHGVLHCLGYDDKTPEMKQKMRDLEDKYLRLILH
jgi:rRNA maturation RNase YbeY